VSVAAELIWAQLRTSKQGDGVFEIPSIPSGIQWESREVRFALGPEAEPRLLVPIDGTRPPPTIKVTRNLSVNVFRARAAGVAGAYLDVMCLDRRLTSVFANFCESVIDRIARGDDTAMAVKLTIDAFQALFAAFNTGRELSDAERIGLLGELWMLEQLVSHGPALLTSWTGPSGQRHDFRRTNTAIEIKTSGKKGVERIIITSIEQLSQPDGGKLYLWHPVFEAVMEGAFSISSLLVRILASGVGHHSLCGVLSSLQLDLDVLIATEKTTFNFEGASAYLIEPGFPRFSLQDFGGQLPAGILSMTYEIDLGAAAQWKLTPAEMDRVLEDYCK